MTDHDDFSTAADVADGADPAIAADGGTDEPWSFDTDSDGVTDVVQWNFGDGTWQELVDVDADGKADVLLIDVNGDDTADVQIWDNGDGTYTAAQDADGDGEFEAQETFTRAELGSALPGVSELLDTRFGSESTPVDVTDGSGGTGDSADGAVEYDTDTDGVTDLVQWSFADGTWQQLVDLDGDADADVLLVDVNGDDTADIQIWDNGDGTYTALQDADGDGVFEAEQTFTRAELDAALPGIADALDSRFDRTGQESGGDQPVVQPADQSRGESAPVALDGDSDGVNDTLSWDFGDGTWQELRDLDGDGRADVLVVDTNGDDSGDFAIAENGDGSYTVYVDSDGDGQWDDEQSFTRAELDAALPGIVELLDSRIDGGADTVVPPGQPGGDQPVTQPGGNQPVTQPVDGPVDGSVDEDTPVLLDVDQDGTPETLQWNFGDGTWQELRDLDGDSEADVLVVDVNGDDQGDYAILDNGDGTYTVYVDSNGDGEWDDEQTFTRDELDAGLPGVADLLDSRIDGDQAAPNGSTDGPGNQPGSDVPDGPGSDLPSVDDDEVAGSPVADSVYWFNQAQNGFCVPASVAMIVSAYTGEEILSEEQFVALASQLGLFDVQMDGTFSMTMDDALTLLEAAGVPAEMVVGDMDSLYDTVEEGRGVMLFVDSGEIWEGGEGSPTGTDHAVVLTGIDREAGVAYLSDPGSPDGNMEVVPLTVLEDAWEDSGYAMVVCDEPAPDAADTGATVPEAQQPTAPGSGQPGIPGTGQPPTATDGGPQRAADPVQATVASGPWALLPVVLPQDAVTPALEGRTPGR